MRAGMLAMSALLGLAACDATREVPPTQMVVRVYAQARVRDQLAVLQVRTHAEDADVWHELTRRDFRAGVLMWPVDIVLVPKAGTDPAHLFEVVVAALDENGERLVEARAISQFRPREQRLLAIQLDPCGDSPLLEVCESDPGCLGDVCRTCVGGECLATIPTPATGLPFFTPDGVIALQDAGADNDELDADLPGGDAADEGGSGAPDADPLSDAASLADAGGDSGSDADQPCGDGFTTEAGGTCRDVDECEASNVCSDTYPCTNRPGDYFCRGLFPEQSQSAGADRFADARGVHDRTTGLLWQVALPGDTPGAATGYSGCSGASGTPLNRRCTQAQAANYCGLDLPEHPDGGWRLPTVTELLSIMDDSRASPAIDLALFPNTPAVAIFWTSSPSVGQPGSSWYVDTDFGASNLTIAGLGYRVRCVKEDVP